MELLRKLWWNVGVRDMVWKSYARFFPVSATKRWFKKNTGYRLDLKNPQTLNEKMQYLKLFVYRHNPLISQCTDKYAVREYVKKIGCGEILNELFAVYDSVSEIDWEELPEEFVLKCNHGSGGNIICHDKRKLDIREAEKKLSTWMKDDYGLKMVEFSYEGIKRKIICEKFIKTEDGKPPKDYKFFCSFGEVKFLYVCTDRRKDGHPHCDFFTPEWEWIPVKYRHPNAENKPKCPNNFEEMLEYASKLSADFPLVRVDLYSESNKVIFGELTFLSFGGVTAFEPSIYNNKFGSMFPDVTKIKND